VSAEGIEQVRILAQSAQGDLAAELRSLLTAESSCGTAICVPWKNILHIYERRARWNNDPHNDHRGNIEGFPILIKNLRRFEHDFPGEKVRLYEISSKEKFFLVFSNQYHSTVVGILRWKTIDQKAGRSEHHS
jgi:hypothetical protein